RGTAGDSPAERPPPARRGRPPAPYSPWSALFRSSPCSFLRRGPEKRVQKIRPHWVPLGAQTVGIAEIVLHVVLHFRQSYDLYLPYYRTPAPVKGGGASFSTL